jgi:hypothetical protein
VSEGLTERATIGQSANRTLFAPNEIPERMPSRDAQERGSGTTRVLVGLAVAKPSPEPGRSNTFAIFR